MDGIQLQPSVLSLSVTGPPNCRTENSPRESAGILQTSLSLAACADFGRAKPRNFRDYFGGRVFSAITRD
jgi:hypothetical protein